MNLLTEWKLKKLAKRSGPSADFRTSLRARLCLENPQAFGAMPRQAWRVATTGACVIVLAFGTTTGVFAYESPDVVEGTPLYPIKQGIEQAQESLAASPEAKAAVHATMVGRRVQEAERHVADAPVREKLLHAAAQEIRASEQELEGGAKDSPKRERVLKQVKEVTERYAKLRDRVKNNVD